MLFGFTTLSKTDCVLFIVRLQEQLKEWRYIMIYGEKSFTVYFTGDTMFEA